MHWVTCGMFLLSQRSTVWKTSVSGTPNRLAAFWNELMFSINLKLVPDVLILETDPGIILFISLEERNTFQLWYSSAVQHPGDLLAENDTILQDILVVSFRQRFPQNSLDPGQHFGFEISVPLRGELMVGVQYKGRQ